MFWAHNARDPVTTVKHSKVYKPLYHVEPYLIVVRMNSGLGSKVGNRSRYAWPLSSPSAASVPAAEGI